MISGPGGHHDALNHPGVTGKRAIHLMTPEDRRKIRRCIKWIIRAKDKKEAPRVTIGDAAVYDHGFEKLHGPLAVSRAFDDKTEPHGERGSSRLAKGRKPSCKVVAVSTSQEEIEREGRLLPHLKPDVALAVDSHATDHPDADHRKYGLYARGGPILTRGPNVHPGIRPPDGLPQKEGMPVQIEADPRPTAPMPGRFKLPGRCSHGLVESLEVYAYPERSD